MIRLFFFIITILFATNIATVSAYSSDPEKFKILLFGDSIIAGYGLPKRYSLPSRLQDYFDDEGKNVVVINGGVSGDTTSGGASRLEWTLKEYDPDLLFIGLGGNDMLRGISPDVVKENLEKMLNIAKEYDITIVLNKVKASQNLGMFYRDKFDGLYEDIADEYDVETYPFLLENTFGKPGMMQADNIHPSVKGVDAIVKDFGPFLMENIE